MKDQRDLVDAVHVLGRNHRVLIDIAEMGDLGFDLVVQVAIRAAQQHVGLNPHAGQLFDAVLGGFGLEFTGRRDKRHQGQVEVQDVLASPVPAKLADSLKKGQTLDVPDRAADLADGNVKAFGRVQDTPFDLIRDVGMT